MPETRPPVLPSSSWCSPPPEGKIDWGQVFACLWLQLRQTFRPGLDTASGTRGNPARQLIISFSLMGISFSFNTWQIADFRSFLILLFSSSMLLSAMVVIPDTYDIRQRKIELLASKPVSNSSMMAVRTLLQLVQAAVVCTLFSIIPMAAAAYVYRPGAIALAGSCLMLGLGSFSLIVFWTLAILLAASVFSLSRIRTLGMLALSLASMGVMGCSAILMVLSDPRRNPISLSNIKSLKLLPSTWFAVFFLDGSGIPEMLQRAGVVFIIGIALWTALKLDVEKYYPRFFERLYTPEDLAARTPFGLRLLESIQRIPHAGCRVVPPQALGVAAVITTLQKREEVPRMKRLVPAIMLVGSFALAMIFKEGSPALLLMVYFTFLATVDGVQAIKQTSYPEASWIFGATPLDSRFLLKGIRLTLFVNFFTLPLILFITVFFSIHPAGLALVLTASLLVFFGLVISTLEVMMPALPLSTELASTPIILGSGLSLILTTITAIGYAAIVAMVEELGTLGLALAACFVAFTLAVSHGMDLYAENRLSRCQTG